MAMYAKLPDFFFFFFGGGGGGGYNCEVTLAGILGLFYYYYFFGVNV
jgi:hypothetical protein